MRRRSVAVLGFLVVVATGCKKDEAKTTPASPTPARAPTTAVTSPPPDSPRVGTGPVAPAPTPAPGPIAGSGSGPFVAGGGGRRVPAGFETTFTGPAGKVTIPYTQVGGASMGARGLMLTLTAVSGSERGAAPEIAALFTGEPDLESHRQLAGKTYSKFSALGGNPFTLSLEQGKMLFAKSATLSVTSVGDDFVEGTFSGEFLDGPLPDAKLVAKITDGKFKAYAGPIIGKAMMEKLRRRPLGPSGTP